MEKCHRLVPTSAIKWNGGRTQKLLANHPLLLWDQAIIYFLNQAEAMEGRKELYQRWSAR